jgi:methyltransferase-like protein/2-polyprenyl-3-methyl-5-hydroxy-6-metoxy-1,4-benzoquinol methylase
MKTTNLYDEVPYTSHVYKDTQPRQLATVAALFGLQPPAIEHCRVLELGCASGTNLIAMAQGFPHSEFLGIDLSARQIQEGQAKIQQMGVRNVTLRQMSILDVTPQFGKFDYIIAHGIYSWVPPPVREKILQIGRDNLTPNGLAYISYNVYPGWYTHQLCREMMLFQTQSVESPAAKLKQAKECLHWLGLLLQSKGEEPYGRLLKPVLDFLGKAQEDYLFHDHLEEYNQPVFFYQFMEQAKQYGLHYLADLNGISLMFADNFPREVASLLKQFDDQIRLEQYIDFLTNRSFRKTLLCLQPLSANRFVPQVVTRCHSAGQLAPASATSKLSSPEIGEFTHIPTGQVFSSASQIAKAVCLSVGDTWPQSLSFRALVNDVAKRLSENQVTMSLNQIVNETVNALLELYKKGAVELQLYPPPLTLTVTERPQTTPLARWQAQQQKAVMNLRYQYYTFGVLENYILSLLDGHHNREELANRVLQKIEQGQLEIKKHLPGQPPLPLTNPLERFLAIAKMIDEILAHLAETAFLVS